MRSVRHQSSFDELFQAKDNRRNLVIYVIGWLPTCLKIGKTANLGRRVQQLNTGSPINSILLHTIETNNAEETEARFHFLFRKNRQGGEWFNLDIDGILHLLTYKEFSYGSKESAGQREENLKNKTNGWIIERSLDGLIILYRPIKEAYIDYEKYLLNLNYKFTDDCLVKLRSYAEKEPRLQRWSNYG